MKQSSVGIDPVLFDCEFKLFLQHVREKSRMEFTSFNASPYIQEHEGYKFGLQMEARAKLKIETWEVNDIGSGRIARAVASAIELPRNNLVRWQAQYGPGRVPHLALGNALASSSSDQLAGVELPLFNLYRKNEDEAAFRGLADVFGRKYPLLAYLFFLKDSSRYAPIAPQYFDRAFALLGATLNTNKRCSWENYTAFNRLLRELSFMLSEKLDADVSLLEAHSFAWILSCQMRDVKRSKRAREYAGSDEKTRRAITQARNGQGWFRDVLIDYWSSCSVTGCGEHELLVASHIKPFADCVGNAEALDRYNGLLLTPALDKAFDTGFISFADDGQILVSGRLHPADADALGIEATMKLRRVDPRHRPYLMYHREHCFRK